MVITINNDDMNKNGEFSNITNPTTDDFNTNRLEGLSATIFMPKDNTRGISGVIVDDDKTFLTCGSLYPIEHYIEEF